MVVIGEVKWADRNKPNQTKPEQRASLTLPSSPFRTSTDYGEENNQTERWEVPTFERTKSEKHTNTSTQHSKKNNKNK